MANYKLWTSKWDQLQKNKHFMKLMYVYSVNLDQSKQSQSDQGVYYFYN